MATVWAALRTTLGCSLMILHRDMENTQAHSEKWKTTRTQASFNIKKAILGHINPRKPYKLCVLDLELNEIL